MLEVGKVVDRYTVGPLLGAGGMGRVYRARDAKLDRDVALKVVTLTDGDGMEEAHRRLIREARAAAALDHPSAVSIFDVGEVDGTPYIVMELVPGESLRQAMHRPHEQRDALRWLLEVARVLEAANSQSLIHRDIKPENVMVRPDGTIRVLDFGIARRPRRPIDVSATTEDPVFATLTKTGIPLGTPLYMSPEQIRGQDVDHRTDQFAWGVMAYELLSGQPPWPGDDSLGLIAAILTDEPSPLSSHTTVAPQVAVVVHRALAKRPEDRFATSSELVAALEGAMEGKGEPVAARLPARLAPSDALSGYSASELSEIIERALLRQPATEEGLESGDLIEAARHMGVDPSTLDEAAADLTEVKSPHTRRLEFLRGVRIHAAIWAACSVFFLLLNLLTGPSALWFLFPVAGWGLGVAIHAIAVYFGQSKPEPRPRYLRRMMQKLGGERTRTGLALEPAVRAVLQTAERATPPAPRPPPQAIAPQPSPAAPEVDSHASWDARFAAHRIDSRAAKARGARVEPLAIEPAPHPADEAQAPVEEAMGDEALAEEGRARRT